MTSEAAISAKSPLARREAGILLHPTSLPGEWGNGDLGHEAYCFVDFLVAAGQRVWQILPLGPPHGDGSPYQSTSVHAGNPLLVNIEDLAARGWLDDVRPAEGWPAKREHLARALEGFRKRADDHERTRFDRFVRDNADWLEDFCLYRVLKAEHQGKGWTQWEPAVRDREPEALSAAAERHVQDLERIRFEQFVFYDQWLGIKRYANERGIRVFGDLPIFVAHDSAEVWAQRQYFQLDETGEPTVVAGVPPDYFSATGQRWGNPHYDWQRMEEDDFAWWRRRLETQLSQFDLVRIDHFRGFEAYWEVNASEETAINGRWVQAPGDKLFSRLHDQFDPLPIVAEDLGTISEEVEELRSKHALPGMKVLQFAFDSDAKNPYLPHNHQRNSVVYTGTHDNDTTLGWYESAPDEVKAKLNDYLGHPREPQPWPLVRAAFASVARLAVVPMQDVLGLDSEHRMNRPGTTEGNWGWRFRWSDIPGDLADHLRHLSAMYGRRPQKPGSENNFR